MNCLLSGKELQSALAALPSPTVTITPDSVSCIADGRLHSVRLDTVLPIGQCDPITIPKPSALPDTEVEIYTDCGLVMLNGEPLFSEDTPVLNHPEFTGDVHHLTAADYNRVAPFATWEGSLKDDRKPLWYIRVKGGLLQATDSRMLITVATTLPNCYIWPQPLDGALDIQIEGQWIRQQSGRYSVIHKYDLGAWPELPVVEGDPGRIVRELPAEIRIHDHEAKRALAALGSSYHIELRVGKPIVYRSRNVTILVAPLKGGGGVRYDSLSWDRCGKA